MEGGTTSANGVYMDCGYGMPVSLTINCNGPSCPSLESLFPDLVCSSGATTSNVNCNNGVQCPGPVNFISNFNLFQQGQIVSSTQTLQIDGSSFMGSDNGDGVVSGYGSSGAAVSPPSAPAPASPAVGPPPGTSPASPASTTSASTTTHSVVLQTFSPASRKYVPMSLMSKLMLAFIIIMNVFVRQTYAYSSVHLSTESLMLFPFMWLMLSGVVNGQLCDEGFYPGVYSPKSIVLTIGFNFLLFKYSSHYS
jgi:hypothetical protein